MKKINHSEINKKLKKFAILIPLVLCVLMILYFIHIFNYFNESYYKSRMNEAKTTVDLIARGIDAMKQAGVSDEVIFDKTLDEILDVLDKNKGIYVRLITMDFKNVSITDQNSRPNFDWTGGLDLNSLEAKQIMQDMIENNSGTIFVSTDQGTAEVYWKKIPSMDPQFYLIVRS